MRPSLPIYFQVCFDNWILIHFVVSVKLNPVTHMRLQSRIVGGCCLATKSLKLNDKMEFVEVIMGVAVGC